MKSSSPIIIYQMGKVGSSSIQASLKNLKISNPIYHAHFLSWDTIQEVDRYYHDVPNRSVPDHIHLSRKLRSEIDASKGKIRWKIITMVRDPVARDISDLFENMERDLPQVRSAKEETALSEIKANVLNKFHNFNETSDYACSWFDREIKAVFDFDIYATNFNKSIGYQIYEARNADILVLKLEKLQECHRDAFKAFLNIDDLSLLKANVGADKKYNDFYRKILESISIPEADLDEIYASRYSQHFYTNQEIEQFKDKWSRHDKANKPTGHTRRMRPDKRKKILIVHPEGNINNNPNLTGIVQILCENNYVVHICSLRKKNICQESPCEGATLLLMDSKDIKSTDGFVLLNQQSLNSAESTISRINREVGKYDLIIGVDRGIIEASLIAAVQQVPYGLISYEIFFEEEAGHAFKSPERNACENIAFAVCQDRLRAGFLSIENNIPLEKIITVPVSGRSSKKGVKDYYLYNALGIDKTRKIALLIGSLGEWTMTKFLIESALSWREDWALVIHSRYGLDKPAIPYYEKYKARDNIFFSLKPTSQPDQLYKILHSADVGVALYKPLANDIWAGNNIKYVGMASGKIATYLQHGLPVMVNEIGEMSNHVRRAGLGVVVDDSKKIDISFTDEDLAIWEKNCFNFFEDTLDLNYTITPLVKTIKKLIELDILSPAVSHQVAPDFQKAPMPAAVNRLGLEEIKSASEKYVVTAIVSTYNSERFIRGCLEDLENQTIADKLEIVVVNSGSEQDEDRIITEFQKRYSNIKYIRTENRETVYQAWNRGIRAASGSYITNANTDDRHRPDAFEIMARALDENPPVGAVYADNLITDKENETFENNSAKKYFKRPNFSLRQMLLFSFFGPQPMWRRSIHRKIGYFDESYSVAADYDFFIRLSREFGALHIGEILGLYTRRSLSIENSNREKCVSETRHVLKRYRHIIQLEELYPGLEFEEKQGKARAICLSDQGNCCLFGGLPDIKGALAYYDRALEHGCSEPGLAANLGVAFLLSGDQSQGVGVLRRIAGRVQQAAQNLAIIERCIQKGELPQVGRFKAFEIHHPVVSAAARGKGVVIEKNCLIPVETGETQWIGSDMVRNLPCKTNGLVTGGSQPALVSVIVPTFNRRHILKEALGSILSQNYRNFEIIVVNDGGEDVSELIQEFKDPRIKYFQQKSSKGPAAARNIGIQSAKGKYIAYLDDDDIFYPNHLEALIHVIENSNYKVAYTDAHRIHQEKRDDHYINIKKDLPHSFDFDPDKFLVNNYVPILCFMHEKTCLDNVGFWDETLSTHEDWDLWIRLSRKYKFVHIKNVTAGYTWRKDGTSTTSRHRPDFLLTMEKIYQKHQKYVEHKPHIKLAQSQYLQQWRSKISGAQGTFRCSIIIPVFNQIKYTKHCLETLFKNTPPGLFETIVIDNHSTDGTKEYLKNLKEKVKVITNNENYGFAKACNQGVKAASGEYVLFLNNDTRVEPGWLHALMEVLDKDRTVAAVGSKLLFPDKTIQHAGVIVINDQKLGDPLVARHIYYQQNEYYPKANQIFTYQALTAACLIVRKSAFESVDGFDESYWNGYEDIDLCFKLQQKDWLLVYQPKSVVIHYESQSGPERFRQVGHNIERLHQKWLTKVAPDWTIDANGIVTETKPRRIRPYFIPTNQNFSCQNSGVSFVKLTSIVILTHNQLEYTQKCIESVFEHTKEHFELIVVDNGSSDGTVEYLQSKLRDRRPEIRIKILQNKNNLGFAAGNNQGIATARGDYILLMNNDIVATPGWLERMISCAERDPRIGIVGPMSNSVSGPQLVKDVTYNFTDLGGLNDFAVEFSKRNAGKAKRILRVVGFCMLLKRAVVDKIGGLDSRYGLGNFEDDDFSLRAALAGFESWMADDCFIHHFGNRTFIGAKIDYNASLTKNWEIFKNKWGFPSDLQLGSKYNWAQILKMGFDREKHCCPLNQRNYAETEQKEVSPLLSDVGSLKERYQEVQRLVNDGRQEEAIGGLERLLEMDHDFAMAHNDLGILYYNQGDKEKALGHYEHAVRIEPHNVTFLKNLADFYFVESGRVEEALAIYNKVLEVDFGDVEALMSMGLICEALQRPEDARHFYNRLLEAEPWNVNARQQMENLYPN